MKISPANESGPILFFADALIVRSLRKIKPNAFAHETSKKHALLNDFNGFMGSWHSQHAKQIYDTV